MSDQEEILKQIIVLTQLYADDRERLGGRGQHRAFQFQLADKMERHLPALRSMLEAQSALTAETQRRQAAEGVVDAIPRDMTLSPLHPLYKAYRVKYPKETET